MIQHENPLVERVGKEVASRLADIADYFKAGTRLTLVVRRPGLPEQDMVITDDLLGDVIESLKRRVAADALAAAPARGQEKAP